LITCRKKRKREEACRQHLSTLNIMKCNAVSNLSYSVHSKNYAQDVKIFILILRISQTQQQLSARRPAGGYEYLELEFSSGESMYIRFLPCVIFRYFVMVWCDVIYDMIYCTIYNIFVNCNWVATRWQYYSRHLHKNNK